MKIANFILHYLDLYSMNDKIYFGELTFHDGAGFEVFAEGWDEKLGNLLQLPIDKNMTISMNL